MSAKTRKFLGFTSALAVSMSLLQGANSATESTNPNGWGMPGPSGGTITILTPHRTKLKCAPDSVGFDVDLSVSTFDTPAATSSTSYDPRFHKIEYFWTFDDPGTWTAPQNIYSEWKNRNFAYGKKPSHCFTAPGTYTVTLFAVEVSSGKTATATLPVEVLDANDIYSGTQTVCIYPVGGSPGTVPSGAQTLERNTFTSNDAAWSSLTGSRKRILFQRGGTYTAGFNAPDDWMFGDYGSGAKPIINPVQDQSIGGQNYVFQISNRIAENDFRAFNLRAIGNYDPALGDMSVVATSTTARVFVQMLASAHCVVSGCYAEGFAWSTIGCNDSDDISIPVTFHFDDTTITKMGGQYPCFVHPIFATKARFAMTGVAIVQSVDAFSGEGNFRAPVRLNQIRSAHMRGCDFFHKDPAQPSLKMMETPWEDGLDFHVHTCSFEGCAQVVSFNGNIAPNAGAAARSYLINGICESNLLIGTAHTEKAVQIRCSGVTVRNNLIIIPASPTQRNHFTAFFYILESKSIAPGDAGYVSMTNYVPSDAAYAGEIVIQNNTCIMLRNTAQNTNFGNFVLPVLMNHATPVGVTPLDLTEINNVFHMPNLTSGAVTTYAPLDTTPVSWDARFPGYTNPVGSTNTSYATPNDTIAPYSPLPGSSAINSATGVLPYLSLFNTQNQRDNTNIGAW